MRLLIADDDAATRRVLRSYVSSWGHEVVECANGVEALGILLRPDRPAVAILDWLMPGLDGPEVCRQLRALDRDVYVILLTTRGTPTDVIGAIAAGVDEHLSKAMPPVELQARLEAALRVAALREQVAEQMHELRLLFNRNPCALWVADAVTHEILAVNEAACQLYGYSIDAFVRLRETDLAATDAPRTDPSHVRTSPATPSAARHRDRNGQPIEVQLTAHPIEFRGRSARLVLAQDVTRRLLAERLTRLQLEVTRVLAEAATPAEAWTPLLQLLCETLGFDGAIATEMNATADGTSVTWNREHRDVIQGIPPDGEVQMLPVIVGEMMLAGIRLYARDMPVLARETLELLPILGSQIGQFLIRKQSEAELQQAHANLRALVASSPLPIATYDRDGIVQMWNAAAERTFGWSEAEVLGRPNPVVPEEKQPESTRFRAGALRGKHIAGVQVRRQTKDGRLIDVSLSTAPIRGADGVTTGVMSIFQDITEEKAVERELLDAHTETERLFSVMASVLIGLTADRRVTRWNSAAADTFRYKASDAFGRLLRDCPIQWDADMLEQRVSDCQRLRTRVEVTDVPYTIDGRERFLNIVLTPVTAGREAGGVVLLASDVTEYRMLQAQLGQAQKLEALGQLAAGIAHEINTPMQYVGDNVGFMRDAWTALRDVLTLASSLGDVRGDAARLHRRLDDLAALLVRADVPYLLREIPSALEQSLEGVARVSGIVGAMKELSHPGTGERIPVDVNHAIDSTINVARHEWKYVCDIATDLSPSLPAVPGVPGALNQVILNLVVNAAQAIADAGAGDGASACKGARGRITIRTRQADDAVEIEVADTGTGIPDAIRSRVFDPFFTTKEVGRGTGQGLAIAHDIVVHKHQGQIWFDTEVGRGTTFHVRLPLHATGWSQGNGEADTVCR